MAWAGARPADERWAVALSGGADSLCMLLLLWAHWPERRAALCALHFDHRLRGAAARADARFCRAVCRGLGVRFAAGEWRRPPESPSEGEARGARFRYFERRMARGGIGVLWLGHQQDDIAESMIMRLARGSGTSGLAAPRPLHSFPGGRRHVRPLLTLKRSEIVGALRASGARWREDASNAEDRYFRNKLRSSVLPAWKRAAGRDAVAGAALSRDLLEEDDAALENWVERLSPLTPEGRSGSADWPGAPERSSVGPSIAGFPSSQTPGGSRNAASIRCSRAWSLESQLAKVLGQKVLL